jgi:hypothetical protein
MLQDLAGGVLVNDAWISRHGASEISIDAFVSYSCIIDRMC